MPSMVTMAEQTCQPQCRQRATILTKPSHHVWDTSHRPPPPPVQRPSPASHWTTRNAHAQSLCDHVDLCHEVAHCPLPPAMPLARYAVDPDELSPHPSAPSSHYK